MKRFVLLPCIVLLGVLWIAAYSVVGLRSDRPTAPFPKIDERYMPGHAVPSKVACVMYVPDFQHKYCDLNNEPITLMIQDQEIVRTSIYTYDSGLTVGEVLNAWGMPDKTAFTPIGTATLYWEDHSTYVLLGQGFSPFARVALIAYGKPTAEATQAAEAWRGFTAGKR